MKAKVKGANFEREVVKTLRNEGVNAYRVPRSGAGTISDDIVIGHAKVQRTTDLRVECKRRASLPDWLTDFLSSSELCVMREDKGVRVWLMTDEMFFRLLKSYERERHLSTNEDCDKIKLILFQLLDERKQQLKAHARAQAAPD